MHVLRAAKELLNRQQATIVSVAKMLQDSTDGDAMLGVDPSR